MRFIHNCRNSSRNKETFLSAEELYKAESYWLSVAQLDSFPHDIERLRENKNLKHSSRLMSLTPFIDELGLLRVGGRQQELERPYAKIHPVILLGKHPITKLIIMSEHIRLMHGGPTLVHTSLSRRMHIIGGRKSIRNIIRQCVICRRISAKPLIQKIGNLPIERISADHPFNRVGIDFAGPFYTKYGYIRKPVIVKAYICIFVSLAVKAVHLELVSDLTTNAFLACFRRFMARRGKPSLVMSDHGTNFVGAARILKEIDKFLQQRKTQEDLLRFCSSLGITWKFIPEHAPHFGGLWESAVKGMKHHLKRIMGETKFTFEELTTIIAEVEACMNSRPLTPISSAEDAIEVLTPGHFLIGRPIEAIPNPLITYECNSQLKRWHLVQCLVRHFWQRWSAEYLTNIGKVYKWHYPSRNVQVGDIVALKEDILVPTRWPLARVIETHVGKDNHVRVVTVKTASGIYKRPITKVVTY